MTFIAKEPTIDDFKKVQTFLTIDGIKQNYEGKSGTEIIGMLVEWESVADPTSQHYMTAVVHKAPITEILRTGDVSLLAAALEPLSHDEVYKLMSRGDGYADHKRSYAYVPNLDCARVILQKMQSEDVVSLLDTKSESYDRSPKLYNTGRPSDFRTKEGIRQEIAFIDMLCDLLPKEQAWECVANSSPYLLGYEKAPRGVIRHIIDTFGNEFIEEKAKGLSGNKLAKLKENVLRAKMPTSYRGQLAVALRLDA